MGCNCLLLASLAYYSAIVPAPFPPLQHVHEKVVFFESGCFDMTSMENEFENCSFCTGICDAGGLFPIDTRNEVSMGRPPAFMPA